MPPKFSLQPVLDYRHKVLESLEIELGGLLQSQKNGAQFLQKLQDHQKQLFEELHHQQDGIIDLQAVTHLRSNLRAVEERIQRQVSFLAKLERDIEQKRAEVVEAKQDEETLATLKSKEIERYKAEQARQENRLQDDIYIAQAFRKGKDA